MDPETGVMLLLHKLVGRQVCPLHSIDRLLARYMQPVGLSGRDPYKEMQSPLSVLIFDSSSSRMFIGPQYDRVLVSCTSNSFSQDSQIHQSSSASVKRPYLELVRIALSCPIIHHRHRRPASDLSKTRYSSSRK